MATASSPAPGLPGLGEVVPHVVRIEDADGISGPAAQQVRTAHRHEDCMHTAPVMTDEVDWPPQCFELTDQPLPVLLDCGAPLVWNGGAESGRGQTSYVVTTKGRDERTPHRRSLGISVDQHDTHGSIPLLTAWLEVFMALQASASSHTQVFHCRRAVF